MARRNAKQFQVTPRPPHRETRDGREVTVIEVPIGSMVTQYDIDARSGRLLGLRSYVLSNSQKALQCETELEYGVALPAHLFSFRPPVGLKQQKGYFRMFEDGRIHFGVPGDGTDPSENVGKPTETQQEGGGGMGG